MAYKKSKKIAQQIANGRVYIQASFNNTLITITDDLGNALSWASAGSMGFKGTKKSTPFAAQNAIKKALDAISPYDMKTIKIFVSGVGSGRDSVLRYLSQSGLIIKLIRDITPLPHNGVRSKKPRRV